MKKTLAIGLLMWGVMAQADPSVTATRVQQRFPWNGVVDIDYTIAGIAGDALDYEVAFTGTADGRTFTLTNFVECARCDVPVSNGLCRVAWNAAADGVKVEATDLSLTAALVKNILTRTDAEFMIVDLSSGAASAAYPVRFASGINPEEFNKDVYKTARIVLKRLSKGSFWMGVGGYNPVTGKSDAQFNGDVTCTVTPADRRHYVRLNHDFYLGLFETTQGQYLQVTGSNPSTFKGAKPGTDLRRPVESLRFSTIEAADGFLARISARARKHGLGIGTFALPTESQWEYACRGGTQTMRYFGTYEASTPLRNFHVWSFYHNEKYLDGTTWKPRTSAVGLLLPNPWGFHDIHGNVSELCADWYGTAPVGDEANPVEDPFQSETTTYLRCLCGRSYSNLTDQYTLFSGARESGSIGNGIGFRLALTLP